MSDKKKTISLKKVLTTLVILSGFCSLLNSAVACDNNPDCNCNKPMMINLNDKLND